MRLTINEGFGTIYDRFVKLQILEYLKLKYDITSITEVGTGFPILESSGVGGDSLLANELFDSIQLIYRSEDNAEYAKKFFGDIPISCGSYDSFLLGEAEETDLLFSNNLLEFTEDLDSFVKAAKSTSKYMLFFEDNFLNFGHTLYKLIGGRFMLAPWVLHTPLMDPTIHSILDILKEKRVKVLEWSMMDFPFFAPPSGISPFRHTRGQRAEFSVTPLSAFKYSLIKVALSIENALPDWFMSMSHMLYVVCKGDLS